MCSTWPVKALKDAELALADKDLEPQLLVYLDEDAFLANDVGLNQEETPGGVVGWQQVANRVDHVVNRRLLWR